MTTPEALEAERTQLEALLDDDRHVETTPAATVRAERARLRELRGLVRVATPAVEPAVTAPPPPYQRPGLWEPLPLYPSGDQPPPPEPPPESDDVHEVAPRPQDDAPVEDLDTRRAAFGQAVAKALEDRAFKSITRWRLRKLIKKCPYDLWCYRVLSAALEAADGATLVDLLVYPAQWLGGTLPRLMALTPLEPLAPYVDRSTEPPDARGLTPTQDLILRVVAELGPPGETLDVETIAARARESRSDLDVSTVQHALVSLSHPARRPFPLVDALGLVDRNDPEKVHVTRVRLSAIGREVLADTFPLPLLLVNGVESSGLASPPYNASEVLNAALELLHAELAGRRPTHIASLIHGPDLPTGGEFRWRVRTWRGWMGDPGAYLLSGAFELEVESETQRGRLRIRELPWPTRVREVVARAKQIELPGLEAISDESTCEGQEVLLEFEHVAFAAFAERALVRCQVASQASPEPFHFPDQPIPNLGTLVQAFLDARRAAVRRQLERSLANLERAVELAEGVVIAVGLLDEVLRAMRTSDDEVEGLLGLRFEKARLASLRLSRPYERFTEAQARHIASIRRLPSRTMDAALRDSARAITEAEELRHVLASRHELTARVRDELLEAATRFESTRRTRIVRE